MNALGWTLLHSLWQGVAIALGLAVCLSILRDSRMRYAAACSALCALLIASCVTYATLRPEQKMPLVPQVVVAAPGAAVLQASSAARAVDAAVPFLGTFWIAGALLFYLRSLLAWTSANRLRRRGATLAAPAWQERVDALAQRLQIRRYVTLLESCLVDSPAVAGHWKPVIFAPAGFLAALPPEQIELILLHELAHVRRHDYLINMLQRAVEDLYFYHPAAWWIASRIRVEREHCCDDVVVNESRQPHAYASALAMLEEMRVASPRVAVAASGGNLVKRIHRLLYPAEGPRSAAIAPWLSVSVAITLAACAASAWQEMTPYQRWVNEDVVYIISPEERSAFLALGSDEEREHFIGQFWERRDPIPATPENEMKEEHYRRIAYAGERYGSAVTTGWKTDRGRMYIVHGPPDEIESHPSGDGSSDPYERWRYRYMEGRGANTIITFIDSMRNGEYRRQGDAVAPPQRGITTPTARYSREDGSIAILIPLPEDAARHEVVVIAGGSNVTRQVTLCKHEQVAGCSDTPYVVVKRPGENAGQMIRVIVRNPATAAERVYDLFAPQRPR